jgi:hypothetical protein
VKAFSEMGRKPRKKKPRRMKVKKNEPRESSGSDESPGGSDQVYM